MSNIKPKRPFSSFDFYYKKMKQEDYMLATINPSLDMVASLRLLPFGQSRNRRPFLFFFRLVNRTPLLISSPSHLTAGVEEEQFRCFVSYPFFGATKLQRCSLLAWILSATRSANHEGFIGDLRLHLLMRSPPSLQCLQPLEMILLANQSNKHNAACDPSCFSLSPSSFICFVYMYVPSFSRSISQMTNGV